MKTISNEEYVLASTNKDNLKVMGQVSSKYKALSLDERKQCEALGLWDALMKYDSTKGAKFTTYVAMCVHYRCLTQLQENSIFKVKLRRNPIADYQDKFSFYMSDILNSLSDVQRRIIEQRFVENKTLTEIGKENGYSYECARQKINEILNIIRQDVT